MSFHPEDKFPKNGLPVYNSAGEQYNTSDPRYSYRDLLENTDKINKHLVENLFDTEEGAITRSIQLGSRGFHTVNIDGKLMYVPCETPELYAKRIEQLESALNFTYVGNFRVLTWDIPFSNVSSFTGCTIDTLYSNNLGTILDSENISIDFRYSIDGKTWSLWNNIGFARNGIDNHFSILYKLVLDPNEKFYPEFRFTSTILNPDGTVAYTVDDPLDPNIVIVDFELELEYQDIGDNSEVAIIRPVPICSDEISIRPILFSDCKTTFDPYAVNKSLNIYRDLSKMINNIFGLTANYYSVQPQGRGKDVILKEYTIFDVVDEKCVKLVVPRNQFPDNKINQDPFGLNFEGPFEVHIDKLYFESIYGRGSQPRKRDIIYFEITNRIYEISSTYLFRDFMNAPVYFKLELKKYSPKSNTYFKDPVLKEELDGISLTSDDLFGSAIKADEDKVTNAQQYATTINQLDQDPIRSYVYKDLPIIGYDLNNNWTIVFNNYYDLDRAFIANVDFVASPNKYREAIRYKMLPKLEDKKELSYTSWFSIKNLYVINNLNKRPNQIITLTKYDSNDDFIFFDSSPAKHGLSAYNGHTTNPEGFVAISGDHLHSGGYRVEEIIDEYKFKIVNLNSAFSQGTVVWKMQKAQSRNLISGLDNDKGIRIDIVHSGCTEGPTGQFLDKGSLFIQLNNMIINSPIKSTLKYKEWYGIVVNVSNLYKQVSSHIWEMSYDPNNIAEQSSKLDNIHDDIRILDEPILFDIQSSIDLAHDNPYYKTDTNSYKIYTSPLYLSNIRLFKNMIDIDMQSTVLNQNIVRDSQLAYIVDNAKVLLKVPKFARNR